METTHVDEFTITKRDALAGGTQITWNVDLNGRPFGQIWTFKPEPGFRFWYHAKTLAGAHSAFANYAAAERWIRGQA